MIFRTPKPRSSYNSSRKSNGCLLASCHIDSISVIMVSTQANDQQHNLAANIHQLLIARCNCCSSLQRVACTCSALLATCNKSNSFIDLFVAICYIVTLNISPYFFFVCLKSWYCFCCGMLLAAVVWLMKTFTLTLITLFLFNWIFCERLPLCELIVCVR